MAIEGEFIETGPQKQDPSGVKSRKFGNKFKVSSIAQQKRNFLEEWSWKLIAEAQPPTIPILFTKDARFCFTVSGLNVYIYKVETVKLLSTLTPPEPEPNIKITGILINEANSLQLLVASTDGLLRIWDYLEGTILRTISFDTAIRHIQSNPKDSNRLYVAVSKALPKKLAYGQGTSALASKLSKSSGIVVYDIAVNHRPESLLPEPITISKDVLNMTITFDGKFLILLKRFSIKILDLDFPSLGLVTLKSEKALNSLIVPPQENYLVTSDIDGRIKFWYCLDSTWWQQRQKDLEVEREPRPISSPSKTWHWHAHSLSSLVFTSNSAYLISGGEEAVLVVWQVNSGRREYIPRLGSAIVSISLVPPSEIETISGQEVAVQMRDGTVLFVDTTNTKVTKAISGLKRLSELKSKYKQRMPFLIHPDRQTLVLPSSHPASLQFYSLTSTSILNEIEVAPSNRVSRMDEEPLEPSRIDFVDFTQEWMATVDSWQSEGFTREIYLKFWKGKDPQTGYSIHTRVDRPHGTAKVTSLTFSQHPTDPLLVTTADNGEIKIWSLIKSNWRCRTAFTYRNLLPKATAWSLDGSLLAIAFHKVVTIWSSETNTLLKSFPCPTIAPLNSIRFCGREGSVLVVGGLQGTIAWDPLTCREIFSFNLGITQLLVQPVTNRLVAIETLSSADERHSISVALIFDVDAAPPTCRAVRLPVPILRTSLLESDIGTISETELSPVLPSHITSTTVARPNTIFEDLYGPSLLSQATPSTLKPINSASIFSIDELPSVFSGPTHLLPPLRMLWRSVLTLPPRQDSAKSNEPERDMMEIEELPEPENRQFYPEEPTDQPIAGLEDIFKRLSTKR